MNAPLPAPVLVIGVGNDLRGDDAAGLEVVREVGRWARPGVRAIERRLLTPELVEDLRAVASVVLVDAALGVDNVRFERVTEADSGHCLSHGFTLPGLLALARGLYGAAPGAWTLAIPAVEFEVGTEVSATCRGGIAGALRIFGALLPAPA